MKTTTILASVAILEGIIIGGLILFPLPFVPRRLGLEVNGKTYGVKTQVSPVQMVRSPISLALKYEAPDKKFEEVVKKNLGWLPYRQMLQSYTVLAECAILGRTNYVRILIKNGADVDVAVKDLTKLNEEEAVKLLKQVQIEVEQARTNGMVAPGNQ